MGSYGHLCLCGLLASSYRRKTRSFGSQMTLNRINGDGRLCGSLSLHVSSVILSLPRKAAVSFASVSSCKLIWKSSNLSRFQPVVI